VTPVRTTCPYCGVGCGVIATPDGAGGATVVGDPDHPANFGRLCSKGAALCETLGLAERLLFPSIGGERARWDVALDLVADKFATAIRDHGPDSVAFYVSGQMLTEDYYVANKLMKGFIGSGNIDTNSRLCMASTVAAQVRSFGEDVVPGCYDDFDEADLIVLVGSNAAWCHPVLFQRIAAARAARGTKVVVIDPRRTETCEIADLHLALAPGSDVRLWNGLLSHLHNASALDADYLAAHVAVSNGFWIGLAEADQSVAAIAADCGLDPEDVAAFFDVFAVTPKTVTAWSQGSNQSSSGTDNVTAILNVHLATGRIGKPGASPLSLTGQPNAIGGREVGGLANSLAAHIGFDDPAGMETVRRFWSAPNLATRPGLKAIDLFDAVAAGRIKALWIMATNPAVSLPRLGAVCAALADAPFVVVSDVAAGTDSAAFADVLLPALAWGEKDGSVTNSERRVSRQRAFMSAPGKAMADWAQLAAVATRLGHGAAFAWPDAAAVRAEHVALTTATGRLLDLTADDDAVPRQWPAGAARLFGDGGFPTPDRRARLVALDPVAPAFDPAFPLVLNTGRVRDQWHTMTRTGTVTRLGGHRTEPFVEIHPVDALAFHVNDGGLATITTAHGGQAFRVRVDSGQRRGSLFVPIHWSGATASAGLSNVLSDAAPDPLSGQPGFKRTPATIAPLPTDWNGFLLARSSTPPSLAWWVRVSADGCARFEIAGTGSLSDAADALLPAALGQTVAEVRDGARGLRRALFTDDRLDAVIFLSAGALPSRDWLVGQFAGVTGDVLAGCDAGPRVDAGAQVCACFNVGEKTIIAAIRGGAGDVAAIGAALSAGTSCGSCKPALAKLLAALLETAEA
jgi:assimilatory nitrate reductase catalytic subunit